MGFHCPHTQLGNVEDCQGLGKSTPTAPLLETLPWRGGEHRRGQGVRDDLQVSAPGLEDIEAAGGRHTSGTVPPRHRAVFHPLETDEKRWYLHVRFWSFLMVFCAPLRQVRGGAVSIGHFGRESSSAAA